MDFLELPESQIAARFPVTAAHTNELAVLTNHLRTATQADVLHRVLARAQVDSINGCWTWLGARAGGNRGWDKGGGYGRIRNNDGHHVYVHRLILELVRRSPPDWILPHELVVHHMCLNRLCFNPLHVAWTSVSENAREATGVRLSSPLRLADEHEPVW